MEAGRYERVLALPFSVGGLAGTGLGEALAGVEDFGFPVGEVEALELGFCLTAMRVSRQAVTVAA